MKLIVGLGNPGRKYEKTRHNVGFEVLDRLASRQAVGGTRTKFEGELAEAVIADQKSLLLWPHTWMNRSGASVGPAAEFYKIALADILIVCDDFNLPLGKLRLRAKGSAGGQNGLADILRRLATEELPRLRVGIGPVPSAWNPADFVLGKFNAAERELADEAVWRAADCVECWVAEGLPSAMNRFNG